MEVANFVQLLLCHKEWRDQIWPGLHSNGCPAAYFDFEINIKYISKIRSAVPSDEDCALEADCDHFD